jgi:hypothetical protein
MSTPKNHFNPFTPYDKLEFPHSHAPKLWPYPAGINSADGILLIGDVAQAIVSVSAHVLAEYPCGMSPADSIIGRSA